MHELLEAVAVLGAALIVAVGGGVVHCLEFQSCKGDGTCMKAMHWRSIEPMCSFTTVVTLEGDLLYNGSLGPVASLASSTRGVCAPGERMGLDAAGDVTCVAFRSWPDALNHEVADPDASSHHQKWCGRWLDAGNAWLDGSPKYLSFHDEYAVAAAVRKAEAASFSSPRLASTDMGKLFAACSRTVLGGNHAIRSAATMAYDYLLEGLASVNGSSASALRAMGWLTSHYCETPIFIIPTVASPSWKLTVRPGSSFTGDELAAALFVMGEKEQTQRLAKEAAKLVEDWALPSPMLTTAQLAEVLAGAVGRDVDDADVQAAAAGADLVITPMMGGFAYISGLDNGPAVQAYLRGLAAQCSLVLDNSLSGKAIGAVYQPTLRARRQKPNATALGRLELPPPIVCESLTKVASEEDLAGAASTTWTQLRAAPIGDAAHDCTALARFVFPDRIDQQHHDLTVPPGLYGRLESLTATLRASVKSVVISPAFAGLFVSTLAVTSAVEGTVLRIPGAPRGSWAGVTRDLPSGDLKHSDGVFLVALKAARSMFQDRVGLVFNGLGICDGPPIYDALTPNAYIYAWLGCSVLLLGMLRMPFADARYDETSLASRVGWVVAHELAHTSIRSPRNDVAVEALLHRYPAKVHEEALADVIAAVAVVESGLASAGEVCAHVSQLFCARMPFFYTPSGEHPAPNARGDFLCETLVDLGYSLVV